MLTVADRIRLRREELTMTQADLAKNLGLSDKSSISKIEKSGNDITLKNIERIAAALQVTPSYLMGWEDYYDTESYKAYSDRTLNELYAAMGYKPYLIVCAYNKMSKLGQEELLNYVDYLSHKYNIADKLPSEEEALRDFESSCGVDS